MSEPVTFVDLGAYDGRTTRSFAADHSVAKAYLFEPREMAFQLPDVPVQIIRAAAWISDGEMPLYLSRRYSGEGSTLLREKVSGDCDFDNPVTVETIDFSAWLLCLIAAHVVVKMNIEGAEYAVLERLIHDGTLERIDALHVSFHTEKVGRTDADNQLLRDALRESGMVPMPAVFDAKYSESWRRA